MNKKFNTRIKYKLNKDKELLVLENHIQTIKKIVLMLNKE